MPSKHKTPSRERYEQRKPVFSVRMPKEWHDALNLYLQKTKRSREEFMGLALKQITENYDKVFTQGYEEGCKEGYADGFKGGKADGITIGTKEGYNNGLKQGKKNWALWVTCYSCQKPVEIPPGSEQHEYIRAVMMGKIRHPFCVP